MWRLGAYALSMCFIEKHELGGAQSGGASSGTYKPGMDEIKSIIIANVGILREVHSISSDPLNRLIGESNETEVILEDEIVLALIDSGAVIPQITSQLA